MYNKAFGTHVWNKTGSKALPVKKTDVYDIASLTKTTATLLAVMKLYDGGRLSLTDRVSTYLPFLQDTDKKNITVRELLMHEKATPALCSRHAPMPGIPHASDGRLGRTLSSASARD